MARSAAVSILTTERGLTHYLEEIRRFPLLGRQEEHTHAKRWREHDDRDGAHHLVTSHLRLVAKIAMGYRGYGLPISEVVSEGFKEGQLVKAGALLAEIDPRTYQIALAQVQGQLGRTSTRTST